MRKFTSLMLMLLCAVTTAWAGPTDLPEFSTEGNIKWYTISNTRSTSGKYLYYTEAGVKDSNEIIAASLFYVTGTAEACYIHNYATDKLFTGTGAWNETGVACALTVSPLNTGLMIGYNNTFLNEQNSANGYTEWTDVNDSGSIFVFELVTDFTSVIDVPAAKAAAIAELNNLATVSVIYPAATEAVAAIEAVTAAGTGIAELNAAIEAIDAIVANYKTNAYQALDGKYFTIQTLTKERSKGFMQMSTSTIVGSETANSPANLWQFVENNGAVNIYNPYTGLYMCEPGNSSANIAVTANKDEAGAYHLVVFADAENTNAKIKLTSNGKSVHMAGGSTLVRWDNGGASEWQVVQVTDFSSIISAYKTAVAATMDEWKKLSVVFDASLSEGAKEAVNAINTTGYATFAAIDAEIEKVTDAVAAKMFTFQTTANDAHREGVWVSANPSTGKAIGLHGESNDNSIWSLRHAGGVSFYMYNELNKVYMGAPNANCPLTEAPTTAYTFEIVDAEKAIVEMHVGGQTLHASNYDDDKLLDWDGNEAASRWYIRTIDVAADIQTIIDGLTEADYAVVPALGQYPTAAYNALVEARTTAKTVEAVEAAIAAFKKAKNCPVFTIDGVISYAAGKSVYDDNNGAPNFKATNKYDKTMWWVFDQTATTVGVTESVNVVNYATRNGFWGAEALKIAETDEKDAEDGIFLFYTVGNGTPLHYQNNDQVIVRWNSTSANSGSATSFTYLGNTYDLDQLTDEKIAALAGLQTAYNAKAFYADAEMGDGLGQYKGDKDAFVTALAAAEVIASKTLAQQATLDVADINAATTALNGAVLEINLPEDGKYYRIKGACEDVLPGYYLSSNDNPDGGRIACVKDADASTIFYFKDGKLLSYKSGLYLALDGANWKYSSVDGTTPASTVTFAGSPRVAGTYTVLSTDRYLHYTSTDYHGGEWTVQIDRCAEDSDSKHDWTLEEVTELPVTVTAAGYATFFAPVAVTVAEGVKAYTVTVAGNVANLNEIGETIPANTGVVLAGAESAYDFAITTAAAFEGENVLRGTVAATNVTDDAYVLGYIDTNEDDVKDEVGFYTATKNQAENTAWKNNSHKAYLPKTTGMNAASYSFRFGEGTTGIENVESAETVKAIFDLTGRRVEAVTAPGIYIVNGKKVLVK